jgi:hypothetical protein
MSGLELFDGNLNLYKAVWLETVMAADMPLTKSIPKYPGVATTEPFAHPVGRSEMSKTQVSWPRLQFPIGQRGKFPNDAALAIINNGVRPPQVWDHGTYTTSSIIMHMRESDDICGIGCKTSLVVDIRIGNRLGYT